MYVYLDYVDIVFFGGRGVIDSKGPTAIHQEMIVYWFIQFLVISFTKMVQKGLYPSIRKEKCILVYSVSSHFFY